MEAGGPWCGGWTNGVLGVGEEDVGVGLGVGLGVSWGVGWGVDLGGVLGGVLAEGLVVGFGGVCLVVDLGVGLGVCDRGCVPKLGLG